MNSQGFYSWSNQSVSLFSSELDTRILPWATVVTRTLVLVRSPMWRLPWPWPQLRHRNFPHSHANPPSASASQLPRWNSHPHAVILEIDFSFVNCVYIRISIEACVLKWNRFVYWDRLIWTWTSSRQRSIRQMEKMFMQEWTRNSEYFNENIDTVYLCCHRW